MKICFITNPNSIHSERWIGWFNQRGHEVITIADTYYPGTWSHGILHNLAARINFPVIKYFAWIIWARQIIHTLQPEIVHAHRVTGAGWIGAFCNWHPLIVTPWGSDLYQYPYKSQLAMWLTKRVITTADIVTADSQDLLEKAISFGTSRQKCNLTQWGVERDKFRPKPNSYTQSARFPTLLSIRALKPIYNQDILIKAVEKLIGRYPEMLLILRDYNADESYRQKIADMIQTKNLQTTVKWIGEQTELADVIETYYLADLAISIPDSDGTPISVLEAMACGIPVIASNLPSLREWIVPGENGWLVSPKNINSMLEIITQAIDRPDLRKLYAQRNLVLIEERGDHQKEMEKVEQLYQRIIVSFRR